jgi:SAM-dependent methyltransferase
MDLSDSIDVAGSRNCAACGSSAWSVVRHAARPDRLGRCDRCGLQWLLDPPRGAALGELYATGFYEPAPARGGSAAQWLHQLTNAIRLHELRGIPVGRLLDVGSGKGRFLSAAQAAGWEVLGVEFAPASAEAARAAYGVEVVSGDFLQVELPGTFDAITMWHVLEHLPEPVAAVARASELLRPGGLLMVSVPNIESLQSQLGGESWFHLDLPRHLFHFSPRSLTRLVERAGGLRVTRIGHLAPEMEAIGLVQTTLNRAGFEDDLLYRFAKRDPTAPIDARVYACLALAVAIAPAAVAWSAIAPLLRTGASIQLLAVSEP